jgi:exonuclease III
VILGGDLNGVFDPSCDQVLGQPTRSPDTPLMQFLAQQDLTDIFCAAHPDDHSLQSMTRIDPADPMKGSCIDYILASPELALWMTHSQVVPVLGLATDHQLLFAH